MPTEQGESVTDEIGDPPTPTASHFPQPLDEVMSPQTQPDMETPAGGPDQCEETHLEREEGTSQSQAAHQSHVIKNVDAIFHAIEDLMSKLRQLKVGSVFCSHHRHLFRPCVFCVVCPSSSPLIVPQAAGLSPSNIMSISLSQEIEKAHNKLLKTLSERSVNQESEDQPCSLATVSRTPSLDRGSLDGKRKLK